jgi:hypothetical protein
VSDPLAALKVSASRRPRRVRRAALLVALAACGAAPARAVTVVVPNGYEIFEGNSGFGGPFNCAGSGPSMRYQQVYLGSHLGRLAGKPITELRFRKDRFIIPGFQATTIPGVTIRLSSTAAAPDALSPTFAANLGADATTVFSGDLVLTSPLWRYGVQELDIRLPFTTPFTFNPAGGKNLLLDVTVPDCAGTSPFDAVDGFSDAMSSVWATSATAPTATVVHHVGLVTQFRSEPAGTVLFLQEGRFTVEAAWETGDGARGSGHAVALTDRSGTFWFFASENVELVVKLLDACLPPFDRFWFFAAGMTNVETTITVTDTASSQVKTYVNPQGRPFRPIQDTAAFSTCP